MLSKISEYQNELLLAFDLLPEKQKLQAVQAFIEKITPLILAAEKQYSREEIIDCLSAVRKEIRLAPIVRQSQDWHRGYQGDFEIIRYVLQHENQTPPQTLAFYVEEILLNGAICQQHRNKIKQQEVLIKEAIGSNDSAQIVSIGCGVSEDVKSCLADFLNSNARIKLLDGDEDALKYSASRLTDIADRADYQAGNIYKSIIRLEGRYDLVLMGGVCDYLNDNFLTAVLKRLMRCLKPGGKLFFSNIKTGNPFRIYLEYLSNWILIERSEASLKNMLDEIMPVNMYYEFESDPSGITYMITIHHPHKASGLVKEEQHLDTLLEW